MSHASLSSARLDYQSLRFPTDRLDIAFLRKKFNRETDGAVFGLGSEWWKPLDDLMRHERGYALLEFEETLSGSSVHPQGKAKDAGSELAQAYQEFGLAQGEQVAAQLVGSITTQVQQQAAPVSATPLPPTR